MTKAYDEMPASSGDDEIGVAQLTRLMWRSRRLIAAVILTCGVIAAVISLLLPPIYTARVSLLPRTDQGSNLGPSPSEGDALSAELRVQSCGCRTLQK